MGTPAFARVRGLRASHHEDILVATLSVAEHTPRILATKFAHSSQRLKSPGASNRIDCLLAESAAYTGSHGAECGIRRAARSQIGSVDVLCGARGQVRGGGAK